MDKKLSRFNVFIYNVLKQRYDPTGITGDAIAILNNLIVIFLKRVAKHANGIMVSRNPPRRILSSTTIQQAVTLTVNDHELLEAVLAEGEQAIKNFSEYDKSAHNGKRLYRQEQAGLLFSVSRVERILMQNSVVERKSSTAAIFATAVIEKIIDLILNKAVEMTSEDNRVRITHRHILGSIRSQAALDLLFGNAVMSGGAYYSRFNFHEKLDEEDGSEDASEEDAEDLENSEGSEEGSDEEEEGGSEEEEADE